MEGLATAASGIAVVSLAIQCADSLLKLHQLFKSLKHASEEIREISDDLHLLSEIVRSLRLDESSYRNVLTHLQAKVQRLQGIVAKLGPGFESSRRRDKGRSSFKMVLQRDSIHEFRASLEETKNTLMIGLQAKAFAQ